METPDWEQILAHASKKAPARVPILPAEEVILSLHPEPWSDEPSWYFMTISV